MLTLQEIADKAGLSMKKVRRLEKLGVLNYRPETVADPMVRYFQKRGELTAEQIVALREQPDLLEGFTPDAQKRVHAFLASVLPASPAPTEVAICLPGAIDDDSGDLQTIAAWMRETIPPEGSVTHQYLAVRLALAVPANIRQFAYRSIQRAFFRVRKLPEFADWWHTERRGGRDVTLYHRPREFDL